MEVAGRTLLEITLTRLRSFGVHDVIINVHHFADMMHDYLKPTKTLACGSKSPAKTFCSTPAAA